MGGIGGGFLEGFGCFILLMVIFCIFFLGVGIGRSFVRGCILGGLFLGRWRVFVGDVSGFLFLGIGFGVFILGFFVFGVFFWFLVILLFEIWIEKKINIWIMWVIINDENICICVYVCKNIFMNISYFIILFMYK